MKPLAKFLVVSIFFSASALAVSQSGAGGNMSNGMMMKPSTGSNANMNMGAGTTMGMGGHMMMGQHMMQMQQHMQQMQALMQQMHQQHNPQKLRNMMQEHMQMMQQAMQMMAPMSGGQQQQGKMQQKQQMQKTMPSNPEDMQKRTGNARMMRMLMQQMLEHMNMMQQMYMGKQ